MTKYDQIVALFQKDFICNDFAIRGKAEAFICPLQQECKVNQVAEPIWTAALGSDDTKVMIVAEAPSAKGGIGPHIGGLVKNWTHEKSVNSLFTFVQKYFNTIPYFTDLMKCGVSRQTKEKKSLVFKARIKNCLTHYLLKEIKIIKPEIILCVGNLSFSALKDCRNRGLINDSTKLVKLIHYGRQAGLPLSPDDKKNLIWPIQVGKVSKDRLRDLSYFKDE